MAGPTSERGSGTRQAPSNTVKEREVRDALCRNLGAKTMTEVLTPSGSVDVLSENEVIEVKHYRLWKFGIGQAIAYGYYYPSHKKFLNLFAQKGDKRASKLIQLESRFRMKITASLQRRTQRRVQPRRAKRESTNKRASPPFLGK